MITKGLNVKLAEFLIDKAAKTCGGQAALARQMGVHPPEITELKKGHRPLSPEIAAELADIAGEDARQAAIEAIIERNKGTRKGQVLQDILGKGLAAGVAAMLLFSYSNDSHSTIASKTMSNETFISLYIVSIRKWIRHALRTVVQGALQPDLHGSASTANSFVI